MWIREEGPDDVDAIHALVRKAFSGYPGEGKLESRTVDTLRADHALAVSLVADIDGRIAGHVAFSPARPSRDGDRWYVLGPIAVDEVLDPVRVVAHLLAERPDGRKSVSFGRAFSFVPGKKQIIFLAHKRTQRLLKVLPQSHYLPH